MAGKVTGIKINLMKNRKLFTNTGGEVVDTKNLCAKATSALRGPAWGGAHGIGGKPLQGQDLGRITQKSRSISGNFGSNSFEICYIPASDLLDDLAQTYHKNISFFGCKGLGQVTHLGQYLVI